MRLSTLLAVQCSATLFPPLFAAVLSAQTPFANNANRSRAPVLLTQDEGILGSTASDGNGGILYTNIDKSMIMRIDIASGETTEFDLNSGGANALLYADGSLYVTEGTRQRISRRFGAGLQEMEVVVDSYEGLPFNAPNQMVLDSEGGLYFTDPAFFAGVQPNQGVYYFSPEGDLSQIISDLDAPNGIVLSPDESRLYVAAPTLDPGPGKGEILEYDLVSPGVVDNKRLFAEGFFDNLTRDIYGNIFAADFLRGVKAWSPDGTEIFRNTRFADDGFGPGITSVGFIDPSVGYPNNLLLTTWFGKVYSLELTAPEPSSMTILLLSTFGFLTRRRKRSY